MFLEDNIFSNLEVCCLGGEENRRRESFGENGVLKRGSWKEMREEIWRRF